ncbi:HYC_CC_PP family protein [Croceitalea rosinachiae]|uniref:Uncharacterized protein n=1 Tax=Croceitalea rosinachiae TaxID=3075596 RepID=A0ABU3AB50_9FLAO|nr:hypothetical protein [Croceitalea sp. F388]MDT0606767.1 hypothetical protein [Croceitalea sp. F388]
MKNAFQKVVSVSMAFLLLLSTVSWTVDKHLCMGRVMDIAFFVKADDCGMEAAMVLLEEEGYENHCCDDETFVMQGLDDLKLNFNDFNFDQQIFLVVFTTSFSYIENNLEREKLSYEYYPPPILVRDIQLLDAVFLI